MAQHIHIKSSPEKLKCSTPLFQSQQSYIQQNQISKNSSQYQHLEHLLTCHICLSIVTQPMMCPHCSKLYCQPCIKRCLNIKSECPHCRKSVRALSMMTNCSRFINQIKIIFNDLLVQKQQEQICQQHNIQINYYCIQCQTAICCECQIFGKHKNHKQIQKLSKIYNTKFDSLRDLLSEYKVELNKKSHLIKQLNTHWQSLKFLRQKHTNEAQTQLQLYKHKISLQQKQGKLAREDKAKQISQAIQSVEKVQIFLKQATRAAKKNQKYALSGQVQQQINNHLLICQKFVSQNSHQHILQLNDNFAIAKQSSVIRQLVPQYFTFYYTITQFSKKKEQRSIIYSPTQRMNNFQWRLKIYPNGNQSVEGVYFSIFIQMVQGKVNDFSGKQQQNDKLQKNGMNISALSSSLLSENKIKSVYEYQIQLMNIKHKDKSKNLVREYSSSFECGQSWGYNKYIKLENLQSQGFLVLRKGQNIGEKQNNTCEISLSQSQRIKQNYQAQQKQELTDSENKDEDELQIIYRVRRPTYYEIYKQNKIKQQIYEKVMDQQQRMIEQLEREIKQNQLLKTSKKQTTQIKLTS